MNKIGFVSTLEGYPWGGSEELWSRTASRLVSAGHIIGVNVAGRADPAPQIIDLERNGCQVVRRRQSYRFHRTFARLSTLWLDRFRPQLVVISMGSHQGGEVWMEACHKRGVPYAIVVQATHEFMWPDSAATARSAEYFEAAKACFFVSERNRDFVRIYLASPLKNARIIRNPFNVPYDAAPDWPADNDRWKIACVGRLHMESKGQDLLLQVLSHEKWRARPVSATLFGGGSHRGAIEKLLRMLDLPSVTIAGHSTNIQDIWRMHHTLVLPSRYEGLPLVVVEAMLCSRPCIVTDVAGNTELIEDGFTGFVAAGPTIRCLDEAMERAWTCRGDWRRMGEEAARQVRLRIPSDPIGVFAAELESLL